MFAKSGLLESPRYVIIIYNGAYKYIVIYTLWEGGGGNVECQVILFITGGNPKEFTKGQQNN